MIDDGFQGLEPRNPGKPHLTRDKPRLVAFLCYRALAVVWA
jgi:hypothetical protein